MQLSRIAADEIFGPLGDFVAIGVDLSSQRGPSIEVVGDASRVFFLASISKLISSVGLLVAFEEGLFGYDSVVAPLPTPLTVADLLSHSSGLPFDVDGEVTIEVVGALLRGEISFDPSLVAKRQTKRIYSNLGFELMCSFAEAKSEMSHYSYLREAILAPLGIFSIRLSNERFERSGPTGGAARLIGSGEDLLKLTLELFRPTLFQRATLDFAASVQNPLLSGVLPGFGRYEANAFGLGVEIHASKSPHWMSDATSADTYGHFGASGVFIWIDPHSKRGLIFLGDRDFGADHRRLWPILSERFALS